MMISNETMKSARQALQRAVDLHIHDSNVTHIDLGWRIKTSERNRIEKDLAVRIHLRQKFSGDAFIRFAEAYPERVIDSKKIGFAVDIPQADYELHRNWRRAGSFETRNVRARYFEVLQGGISLGREFSSGYGTLGGLVVDRRSGDELLLSNWHVIAGSAYAMPGLAIFQPALADGGTYYDVVARYERDAIDQHMDAAVARLNRMRGASNFQLELAEVTGVTAPELGMLVAKSGRRSGVTTGLVTGIEGHHLQITPRGGRRMLKHVIHIAPVNNANVSAPGDSGAWWLRKRSNAAVALHFAGSNLPEYALGFSMPRVFSALDISLLR